MNLLASNLLYRRQAKGFTQSYLAAQCDMSQPNYSDIERGKTIPSVTQVMRIAEVLETTVCELLMDLPEGSTQEEASLIMSEKRSEADKDRYIEMLEDRVRALLSRK